MPMSLRTYRSALPDAFILTLYPGGLSADPATGASWALALVDDDLLTDINIELAARGWEYVGEGDQRPAALATWSPPNTSSAYAGGLLDILQAARLSDLNDLRTKLGDTIARIVTLEASLATRGLTDGSE